MKIGFVGNIPSPIGGAEIFLKGLIKQLLLNSNIQIVVARWLKQFISLDENTIMNFQYREKESIEICEEGKLKIFYLFRTYQLRFKILEDIINLFTLVFQSLKLISFFRQEKIELIHCHLLAPNIYFSFIAAKILKLPLVVTIHGTVDLGEHLFNLGWIQRIEKKILKGMLQKCEMVIVVSEEIKNRCYQFGVSSVVKKSCGIDTRYFSPAESDKERGILFIGNMTERKGFDFLLKTYREIKHEIAEPIFFVGKNPNNYCIHEKDIYLVGCLNSQDLLQLIRKVKLIVLPSKTEGLPLSILEGMSCGKIVLTSRVGELQYLINHGKNGFLLSSFESEELKERIKFIISNFSSLSRTIGLQARRSVKDYDIKQITQWHIKLYKQFIT